MSATKQRHLAALYEYIQVETDKILGYGVHKQRDFILDGSPLEHPLCPRRSGKSVASRLVALYNEVIRMQKTSNMKYKTTELTLGESKTFDSIEEVTSNVGKLTNPIEFTERLHANLDSQGGIIDKDGNFHVLQTIPQKGKRLPPLATADSNLMTFREGLFIDSIKVDGGEVFFGLRQADTGDTHKLSFEDESDYGYGVGLEDSDDIDSLINDEIRSIERASCGFSDDYSGTEWVFYHIRTRHRSCTLRFVLESETYYSSAVSVRLDGALFL